LRGGVQCAPPLGQSAFGKYFGWIESSAEPFADRTARGAGEVACGVNRINLVGYRPQDPWKMHDVFTSFSPQNKCVMKNTSNSISTAPIPTIPLDYQEYPIEEVQRRSLEYYDNMKRRRTVRDFSRRKVPLDIIENCLRTADTAPNGANQHPWHFVVVSDPEIKIQIREAAEKEEQDFYKSRASREWLEALAPLGTDENKPFLETAPYLIAIFAKVYGLDEKGKRVKHYYVNESVGIATGLLISAIHHSGLASLTHTPSPMRFLNQILERPERERPFLLLVIGYPAADVRVPDIQRKSLPEISTYF